MIRRLLVMGLTAAALTGCAARHSATRPHATVDTTTPQPAWMQAATLAGSRSIGTLDARFAHAIHALSRAAAAKARAEGALLDPQAAQLAPQLSPGPYHCRLIHLGGARGIQAYPPDICYVLADKDNLAFAKSSGDTRPEGHLYADGDKRMVLLGTWRRAAEKAQYRYGDNAARDITGVIERVSSFRWRVIVDRAAGGGAALDVYEMVPVPPEVKGAKPMVPRD